MNRDDFYGRVREAVRSGAAHRSEVRTDLPERVGYVGAGDDVVARMAEELSAVDGIAHRVADDAQARSELANLLTRSEARSALCWQHPLLERLDLKGILESRGVACYDHQRLAQLPPDEQRERALEADIGISSATYAIAETGTLAVASEPGRERWVSLLPPVHVAVIERTQIVPDLFDFFDALGNTASGSMPANLTLITGPSKTGDIELRLVTGVHGPGRLHVVIIDR